MVSGTIRVNVFKGIDRLYESRRGELASDFLDSIRQDWTNVLTCLPTPNKYDGLLEKHMKALNKIYSKAYEWNRKVHSHCISLDFLPYLPQPNANFDNQTMDCQVDGTKRPSIIIGAVAFGLLSSVAIGKGKRPEFVCQQKARIISEYYFRHG